MEQQRNSLSQIAPQNSFAGDQPLSVVLNQLFYLGLALAVVLALFSVVRGGLQYMAGADAADSKNAAKRRIQAAVGGLVLAFGAVLILNTINPNLTDLRLKFETLSVVKGEDLGLLQETPVEVENLINQSVAQYQGITQEAIDEMLRTGKIPSGLSPAGQKILAEALNAIGNMKSGAIPGTDGGNKACAAVVNMIIARATGSPINGSNSTIDMQKSLASSDRFVLVGSDYSQALPGDIIISPTGKKTGHVGIVATAGATQIISNSSSAREVKQNHTATSWSNYYEGTQGLQTYIYRPR